MADDASSSDDESGFGMLFKTTYELKEIEIGESTYRLLVSPAASTDYDKTGEVLWPAAYSLAKFIEANASALRPTGTFLELGAGMGLPSIVLLAKQPPALLISSDHQRSVLTVLEKNIRAQLDRTPCDSKWCTFKFEWGLPAHLQAIKQQAAQLLNRQHTACDFPGFDYIIASDVIYSSDAVDGLLTSVRSLLNPDGGIFVMAHRTRWTQVDKALEAGWEQHRIGPVKDASIYRSIEMPSDEQIFVQRLL
ncbi:MAG: methyltransferase domain-containing protein [archaeon]|nr:methyltransferase domain-containing protein [archaeon]